MKQSSPKKTAALRAACMVGGKKKGGEKEKDKEQSPLCQRNLFPDSRSLCTVLFFVQCTFH
jgi:hypothetical protein